MTKACAAGSVLLGWALLFGTAEKGWREADTFQTQRECEAGRDARAHEVQQKSKTKPPMVDVLKLYQCVEIPKTKQPPS